jgi:hypothetical protein
LNIKKYSSFFDISLKYFEFNSVYDGVSLKNEKICLDNGLKINLYDVLENPKDCSFNKKTGMVLTDYYETSSVFIGNSDIENSFPSYLESSISSLDSLFYTPSSGRLYKTSFENTDNILIFNFYNDFLTIENNKSEYLTYTINNELLFQFKTSPISNFQKFEFLINKNSLILFPYNTNKSKVVVTTNPLQLSAYNYASFQQNISSYYLKFDNYKTTDFNQTLNSFTITYKNNPIENIDTLNYESNYYKQNFLLLFPYEYQFNSKYPIYIHGLKNYQTPEYDYSKNPFGYDDIPRLRRTYDSIFTGTNQYGGTENVFLGYRSNTQVMTFKKDIETIFFYPITSERKHIQESGLIEDGAKSGDVPFESDRVCIDNIDYSEYIPQSSLPESVKKFDGTWACSWLSGNSNNSIWMDRYYNAAYYTLNQALSTNNKVYNPHHINIESNVWDEPSQMFFEPGVRYKFFRYGEKTNFEYVKSFDSEFDNNLSSKILHIEKWNSDDLIDSSIYKNDGKIFFNSNENLKNDFLVLDGKNHVIFSDKNLTTQTNNFTVSLWVNVDDWGDITGEQIFGNYYDGGFGLINNSDINIPTFTIVDNKNNRVATFNYRLLRLQNTEIEFSPNQKNKIIQKYSNFEYWIFDTFNLSAKKYDIEGKILNVIESSFLSNYIQQIDQVESDSNKNIYLFDKSTKILLKLNPGGNFISFNLLTKESFQIDLNDQIVDVAGSYSSIDQNNNLWEIVGGNLYKNGLLFATIGNVQNISFDAENNLWILHEYDKISKLNTTTEKFEFSIRIGNQSNLSLDSCDFVERLRNINFLRIPSNNCNLNKTQDVAVIFDEFEQVIYILTQTGMLLTKLNLKSISNKCEFYANGDFTGYQHTRKYENNNKNLSFKFQISNLNDIQIHSLSYPTNLFYKGWHLFSFVFNSDDGYAKYYIDSMLVDEVYFPNTYSLHQKYKPPFLLGANNLKNKVLNDLIGINDGYKFYGKVSDLRFYNKVLSKNQIEAIYKYSPFSIKISDMKWNVPVGERNFIECIDQWYKMQITGSKSKYFNINIRNMDIDDSMKVIIEKSLKNAINKIIPSYNAINKINWM